MRRRKYSYRNNLNFVNLVNTFLRKKTERGNSYLVFDKKSFIQVMHPIIYNGKLNEQDWPYFWNRILNRLAPYSTKIQNRIKDQIQSMILVDTNFGPGWALSGKKEGPWFVYGDNLDVHESGAAFYRCPDCGDFHPMNYEDNDPIQPYQRS